MLKLVIKQGWQDAQHFRDRPLHTYIHEIAKCGGHYSEINALLKKVYFIMNSLHGGFSLFTELFYV